MNEFNLIANTIKNPVRRKAGYDEIHKIVVTIHDKEQKAIMETTGILNGKEMSGMGNTPYGDNKMFYALLKDKIDFKYDNIEKISLSFNYKENINEGIIYYNLNNQQQSKNYKL